MRDGFRGIATIGLAFFVVIGCGGSSGTAASASTEPASPAAVTPEPASGGGSAAVGVCDLVTADELAEIFGVPSVTATVFKGPPDSCIVESAAGDSLTAWSLTLAQAATLYDSFVNPNPSSIEVTGIGDKAAFVENTGLLVLKGNALLVVSLSAGVGDLSEGEQQELAKKVATKAASRM
jgi:hypothetical protein